jgi:hypothetical protein
MQTPCSDRTTASSRSWAADVSGMNPVRDQIRASVNIQDFRARVLVIVNRQEAANGQPTLIPDTVLSVLSSDVRSPVLPAVASRRTGL